MGHSANRPNACLTHSVSPTLPASGTKASTLPPSWQQSRSYCDFVAVGSSFRHDGKYGMGYCCNRRRPCARHLLGCPARRPHEPPRRRICWPERQGIVVRRGVFRVVHRSDCVRRQQAAPSRLKRRRLLASFWRASSASGAIESSMRRASCWWSSRLLERLGTF